MSRIAGAAVALALLALPSAARADGPMVGGWSYTGVAQGNSRYVAIPIRGGTLLERVAVHGGQPLGWRTMRREIGIPMVTLTGAGGGLSHDGRRLVMASQPGFGRPNTELSLFNAHTLGLRRTYRLKGDFAFDALSPDGSTIYLIQLLDPRDLTRYAVRALDWKTGKLAPKPIVDPREPDEQMRGYPYARTTSADGRFVYTLYNGGKEPFVHALDTTGRTAACIDIPKVPQDPQSSLRLQGRRLTVLSGDTPMAYIDTITHRVTKPGAAVRPASSSDADGGGAPPLWALLAAAAAVALGAAAAVGARRRRAGAARS
ncbi:MAG TPA: hypothetical protein VH817_00810 [Thermoleophilaceae bacterium]